MAESHLKTKHPLNRGLDTGNTIECEEQFNADHHNEVLHTESLPGESKRLYHLGN